MSTQRMALNAQMLVLMLHAPLVVLKITRNSWGWGRMGSLAWQECQANRAVATSRGSCLLCLLAGGARKQALGTAISLGSHLQKLKQHAQHHPADVAPTTILV